MTLKLHDLRADRRLVAAPTAGLPEQVGGERNWDYRYTWIRDASFSVHALLGLGFTDEARGVPALARGTASASATGDGRARCRSCTGSTARRISTRRCSTTSRATAARAPVRIGNGAADQLQLDIYGEALDSLHLADEHGLRCSPRRAGQRPRGISTGCATLGPARGRHLGDPRRPAGLHLRPADVLGGVRPGHPAAPRAAAGPPTSAAGRPSATRSTGRSWSGLQPRAPGLRPALRHRRARRVAAARCRWSASSSPTDPMWQSTLRAMDADLVSDSLVYRYDPRGLPGRAARLRGHVLHVHVLVRRRARPLRPARRRPAHLREDAHLRQPPRPVLRGDRPHRASSSATSRRRSATSR